MAGRFRLLALALSAAALGGMLLAPTAIGAPLTYQNYGPPFHAATFAQRGVHLMGGNISVSHSIHLTGNYSLDQNISGRGNETIDWLTFATFRSATFSLGSPATHLHANTSGVGTGRAVVDVGCSGVVGNSTAKFGYLIEYGIWDRSAGRWVGHHTFRFTSANVSVTCPHSTTVSAQGNLTVGWSLGLSPSPATLNASDQLQIVTILIVHTNAASSKAGWAAAHVTLAVTLLRMQAFYY